MLSNNNIGQFQRQANNNKNNNCWFAIQVYLKKFLKLRFFCFAAVLLLLYFKERKIQFCCVFKFPISLFSLDFCLLISCECAYEESVCRCCRFFHSSRNTSGHSSSGVATRRCLLITSSFSSTFTQTQFRIINKMSSCTGVRNA